jgi:two-component system response regulator FixJ
MQINPSFMTKTGHIYVIDDDHSMRISLSRMLNEIGYTIEQFSSGQDFLRTSLPIYPSVVLLDMRMPDITGVELQQKLLDLNRTTPIIFISGESHPQQIINALKKGALDFLIKPFNVDELLAAISKALEFDKSQQIRLSRIFETKQVFLTLTQREKEVCSFLVRGLLNKQIALELGTVNATIKVHKSKVMNKMGAGSLQALVKMYLEADLDNA